MGNKSAYATSYNGHYVYADITWDDNLKVTVELTNVNAGWCVKIRGTGTIKCSGSMSNTSRTFYADYEGQEFVLQVYDAVEGSYVNEGKPFFTVGEDSNEDDDDDEDDGDSGGSSGGGSSGGGSSGGSSLQDILPNGPWYMWVQQGAGTKLTVRRVYTESGAYIGELVDGIEATDYDGTWYKHNVYNDDYLMIDATALPGYTIDIYNINGYNFNFEASGIIYESYYELTDGWNFDPENTTTEPRVRSTAKPNQYTLTLSEGSNSTLTVIRTSSNKSGASLGQLTSGSPIYHDDVLQITCNANTGYDVSSIKVEGSTILNGDTYTVSGATTITSSAEVKSYDLIFDPDTGTTITVKRTSSPIAGASTNTTWTSSEPITYEDEIYYNDKLTITFSSSAGYQISQQLVNQASFVSGSSHTVTDDVEITTITELSGIVHIFNGSDFNNYAIHIFNGSTWDQYTPWIFDGSQWCICS